MTATIQRMPAARYHSDPAVRPSLSSSSAQLLVNESPAHAFARHPKLGGTVSNDSASRMEIGSVAHKLALGSGADVSIISADNYRTKAAQEARTAAVAAGTIPILQSDYDAAEALSKPLAEAASDYLGAPVADCLAENVVMWEEAPGCWRRIMVDLMTPDYRRICDLKTTQASVSPQSCQRRIYADGYYFQNAFYLRGLDALDPAGMGLRRFGFVFAEQSPPYAVSPPIELSEAGLDMGRKQVERACKVWDACLASGVWPGYSRDVYVAEPPSWELQRQMEDENDVRV